MTAMLAVPATAAEPYKLTKSDTAEIERSVRRELKDPESARFKGFLATKTKGGATVCGFVNAKNSYGGYTGFVPFSGYLIKARKTTTGQMVPYLSLVTIGGTRNDLFAVRSICLKDGIRIE